MNEFLYFSFIQGVFAFFAPCAAALLPAYVTGFIARNTASHGRRLWRGVKLAALSVLGVLTVYGIAGVLIVAASQLIKQYMKYIATGMGVVIIVLGILQLFEQNISLDLHVSHGDASNEVIEAYLFGVAYAIGALGCLFPLFLVVATEAITAESALQGLSYFIAYFAGIGGLLTVTIIVAVYAKDFVSTQIRRVLPYIERATGVLLILAGIYIIYYQLVLF